VAPTSVGEGDPPRGGTTREIGDIGTAVLPPTCEDLESRLKSTLPDGNLYPDVAKLLAGDEPAACRMAAGDVNLDGRIDDRDLADFLVAWADGELFRGDLNRDGQVDSADLWIALAIESRQAR
jgi:hypothetical protein